jgi:phosphatidylglycerol---prolipoprotein diacylglyceryl transferase
MHTTIQKTHELKVDSVELSPLPTTEHEDSIQPNLVEFEMECRPSFLDNIVIHANRLAIFGVSYRPYWIMSDVAMAAALIYACAFSHHFRNVSGLGLGVAVLAALLIYKVVLEIKAIFCKAVARSFLQDCLTIIIPCFVTVSLVLRQPLSLALAFLGTLMPLYGCLARIGCFLGGCCFGRPSRLGVRYPASIFESTDHTCRRFSPSPNPGGRVFPIQLVESAAQATLFATLVIIVWHDSGAAWAVFWIYLSLYAIVRFVLDFFRTVSARPRYWRFSEAQLVCIGVQAVTFAIFVSVVVR